MLDEATRRSISPGEGFGLILNRKPQTTRFPLPAGTEVVSADSHFPLAEDIWYQRFPTHLKEKAPRIWWDETAGIFQLGVNFKPMFPPSAYSLIKTMEDMPGAKSLQNRMKDLDAEGIAKEIVFPQVLPIFFSYPDFEVRECLFRIYNEFMAEQQASYPKRFFPVAIPNYWDPAKAADSVRYIKKLGLRTFLLPMVPGKRPDGSNIIYNDPVFDPMWAAVVETGLPICFHVGEKFDQEGINGEAARLLFDIGPNYFRKIFGQLVFGLVFDRFPKLQVVFAEAGVAWVASALQDAEMIFNTHGLLFDSLPEHRPSYYWHRNCYATFMADMVGLRNLDIIGADRTLWAADYPHHEGNFGYSHDVMQQVIDMAGSSANARNILGGTASKLFNI